VEAQGLNKLDHFLNNAWSAPPFWEPEFPFQNGGWMGPTALPGDVNIEKVKWGWWRVWVEGPAVFLTGSAETLDGLVT
jgi:hypothetical protein